MSKKNESQVDGSADSGVPVDDLGALKRATSARAVSFVKIYKHKNRKHPERDRVVSLTLAESAELLGSLTRAGLVDRVREGDLAVIVDGGPGCRLRFDGDQAAVLVEGLRVDDLATRYGRLIVDLTKFHPKLLSLKGPGAHYVPPGKN